VALLKNLRAEMARNDIKIKDLSTLLGVRYATVCDKLNGKSQFCMNEAFMIKGQFFPNCSLEYLFDTGDHQNTA
jgi:hypothetical protein